MIENIKNKFYYFAAKEAKDKLEVEKKYLIDKIHGLKRKNEELSFKVLTMQDYLNKVSRFFEINLITMYAIKFLIN